MPVSADSWRVLPVPGQQRGKIPERQPFPVLTGPAANRLRMLGATLPTAAVASDEPEFKLLSQTKNADIAAANQGALARFNTAANQTENALTRYLADTGRLNAQAGKLLQADLGQFSTGDLRGQLADENSRYERATQDLANRAWMRAARDIDQGQMAMGLTGLSSDLLNRRAQAFLDINAPLQAELAKRRADQAFALKQMDLANAGRGVQSIGMYQQQLANPILAALNIRQAQDQNLNAIANRDMANTFYGLQTQYKPQVPTALPLPMLPQAGVNFTQPQPVTLPAPSAGQAGVPTSGWGIPSQSGAVAPLPSRRQYFNNGRPIPTPYEANAELLRALQGQPVSQDSGMRYNNGAPMPSVASTYAANLSLARMLDSGGIAPPPIPSFTGGVNAGGGVPIARTPRSLPTPVIRQRGQGQARARYPQWLRESYRANAGVYPEMDQNFSQSLIDWLYGQVRTPSSAGAAMAPVIDAETTDAY